MSNPEILKEIANILWTFIPPEKFPSGLSSYDYLWEYRVSQCTYKSLLGLLNQLDFNVKKLIEANIDGYKEGSTPVAKVIALVISEWFKRDSPGLDGDGAMDIFTCEKMPSPEKIWTAAGFDYHLLHKAKKARLCQTALCVMGGFPLSYVNEKESRFENLINTLSEDDSERNGDSWDALFDDNNSVFSGSLKNGSCKKFVDALWHYLETEDITYLPFNNNDITDGEFKKFCGLIRNGYDKKLRKDFFKETHFFYTADEDYSIQAQLKLQVGFKKDNNILYAAQLEKLGIGINTNSTDKLMLKLKAEYYDGSITYSAPRCYNKIGNYRNDFISAGLTPLSIDYNLFDIKELHLILFSSTGEEKCIRSYPIGESFELYSTSTAYCWSSRRKNNFASKVLLLDYGKFQDYPKELPAPLEKRSDSFGVKKPIWSWLYQTARINLIDADGRTHTFDYDNTPPLQVSFSCSDIDKSIRINECTVKHISPTGISPVRLLLGKITPSGNDFNMSVITPDKGRIKKSDVYKLEYKPAGAYRYVDWTVQEQPQQGFLTIRVSTNANRQPYITDVYYIPSKKPVERDLEKNLIVFNNTSNVYAYCPPEEKYNLLDCAVYNDTPPTIKQETISDTVIFRIGSEDEFISIEVYRAFHLQELIKDNIPFKQFYVDRKKEIPVLFREHIKFRTINAEGCKITEVDNLSTIIASNFPEGGYFSHPKSLCNACPLNEAIDVYIYKPMTINGDHLCAKVSQNHYKEYIFYYWDGYRENTPEILQSSYDFNTSELSIDCSGLSSDRGVIFQSRKNCNPNNYYRPFYIRKDTGLKDTIRQHTGLMYSLEDVLYAYDLYKEHQVFSAVFSPLYVLHDRRDRQKGLIDYALQKENYSLSRKDIYDLCRLASEVGFDWILIPRKDIFDIVQKSGSRATACIESFRKLFENSSIVKRNFGDNRYEKYYFKRIFVDNIDYFSNSLTFDMLFKTTRYRQKGEARKFIELIKGNGQYKPNEVQEFIRKNSDYTEYVKLFHDVFYQYVIKNQ